MCARSRLKLLIRLDWESHHLEVHLIRLYLREPSRNPLSRLVGTALILNHLRLWLLRVSGLSIVLPRAEDAAACTATDLELLCVVRCAED